MSDRFFIVKCFRNNPKLHALRSDETASFPLLGKQYQRLCFGLWSYSSARVFTSRPADRRAYLALMKSSIYVPGTLLSVAAI